MEPVFTHRWLPFACLRWILALVCFAALIPFNTASAQTVPNAALLQLKGEFLKRVNQDQAAIASDQTLLARAQSAHQHALSENDSDGMSVTAMAITNAQQALDLATQNLSEDQKRLHAVDQALIGWTTVGDSLGLCALATIAEGTITVDTPQGPEPFDRYRPVRPGQHIRLGPDAFLELQLGNGSAMHLGPGTDFEYERDVKGAQWQVFKGELHKFTPMMGIHIPGDDALYRGLVSVCGVRGTDFTLSTSGGQDTITVLEGSVEVDPGLGRSKVTLTGGQKLIVPKAGAVGPVTSFDPNTMRKWWEQ